MSETTFDPDLISGAARYKLLVGGVTPRPVAVVSTVDAQGVVNVAPYSFFTGGGHDPMALVIVVTSPSRGGQKDTLRNLLPPERGGQGAFVVNLATESYARAVSALSESLPFGESELDHVPFQTLPSEKVAPPRLAVSPIAYECVTTHVVPLADGAPGSSNVVVGRVVMVHAHEGVVDARHHVDWERVRTIGRMGGSVFARVGERFEVTRGLGALSEPAPIPEDVNRLRMDDPDAE
jgi:flavin reductase (DIM6/NTAB) family NADH-FMN oxidoreductase RutF